MLLRRRPEPLVVLLDEVVMRVGPTALSLRPALLGQELGRAPFDDFDGLVVSTLPPHPASALGELAMTAAAGREWRPYRPALDELVRVLGHRLPGSPLATALALAVLSLERARVAERLTDSRDSAACRVAAEELAVAAFAVAEIARPTTPPPGPC